jgi:hypothetical protein
MKLKLKEGTTSKLVRIFVQDSSATTGAGLTGLAFNTASLTAYWIAEGDAAATQITLATMTAGTWASGGFDEVDATNMPGVYEIGLPDVVVDATSEGSVVVMLKGATNMAPVLLEIELDAIDYRAGVVPTTTVNTDMVTVGAVAAAVLNEAMSGHTTADSLGLFLNDQYDLAITGITTGVETRAGKHSVAGTIMMSTNGALSGETLTAKKPSDDTTFQAYTVTTDAAANNITGVS